jgi:hypothetical protein
MYRIYVGALLVLGQARCSSEGMSDMTVRRVGLVDDLPVKLVACARRPAEKAAVSVLARHDFWLRHPGFRLDCIREFRGEVWVVWRVVRRFLARTPCSALDHEVLLLAVELALSESDARFRRSPVLIRMDTGDRALLAEAISFLRAQPEPGPWR